MIITKHFLPPTFVTISQHKSKKNETITIFHFHSIQHLPASDPAREFHPWQDHPPVSALKIVPSSHRHDLHLNRAFQRVCRIHNYFHYIIIPIFLCNITLYSSHARLIIVFSLTPFHTCRVSMSAVVEIKKGSVRGL